MSTRVPRVGYIDKMEHDLNQAQDVIYGEIVRPIFPHEKGTFHCWIFGAIAELLDNVVDEIPHGATKVLIDTIPNPRDRSPSLLIQDDGGGMKPNVLWNCMNGACQQRKPPNSIGENGEGFKAAVSCLGANVIVFTRCVNTRMPSQSIGFLSYVVENTKCQEHIRGPMVHYTYNPVTGGIIRYERHPEQFSNNMSTLLRLSPYNSEEELLQNFNDLGPRGTKIIVFNLCRNNQGNLELDFDTNKKDIRINDATMSTQHKCLEKKNSLVYQYMRSLRAYVSILYLRLPKHFRIVLRGEVVKPRNIAAELKHSMFITQMHHIIGREDKVVMGLLDGAKDDGMNRFCFYYKHRLILPFVPLFASPHKGWSIVGVLQAKRLKPAKNKQDFMWSDEISVLQNILKEMTTEFWKQLTGKRNTEPSLQLTLAPPVSYVAKKLRVSSATGLHSQVNSSAPVHHVAPIFEPSYGGSMPPYSVKGAPPPPPIIPPLPAAAEGEKQLSLMATANALYHGTSSNRSSAHSTTLSLGSNYFPGIQGAHVPRPAFPTASMAVDGHRLTMPAIASNNDMDFNASPVCTPPPPPARHAPPFSQPNCSDMLPNEVMRAPAPHLAASSRLRSARAMPPAASLSRVTIANTMGALAPSHRLPPPADTDRTALGDLPIKMERDGMVPYVDGAHPVPAGVVPAAAETKAGVRRAARVTSDATPPSSTAAVSLHVAEAHIAETESSAIINGGASSSPQGQKSHGGNNNQKGQGANLVPNQGGPMVTVRKEMA